MSPVTKVLNIRKAVLQQILDSFDLKQEDGGVLGMKENTIVSFCFDKGNDENEYTINVLKFSKTLEEWDEQGIEFSGFIHSHIGESDGKPSIKDFLYLKKFMKVNDGLKEILFPIVFSKNNTKEINFFLFKNNEFIKLDYLVV